MSKIKNIIGPMRVPFLVLGPCCVFLGIGSAVYTDGQVIFLHVLLALLGGLAAHISVNSLNEYFDYKSGLDFRTVPTPFSGGSGTLPRNPAMSTTALLTGIISALITAIIGIYFLIILNLALLPLGILGLIVIVSYTILLNHNWFLCLIAPGLGFGTFMVMGTYFVLTNHYSMSSFFASLVPFFLVSNLLLLNQFPDVEADKSIGRKNIPIVFGKRVAAKVFLLFLILTYASIILGIILGFLPIFALLGLASILIAIPMVRGVLNNTDDVGKLIPFMGKNVIITLITPVLTAIGLLLA